MTPTGHLDTEACYRAVSSRDRRFDGVFYTAVRTTGIYCRPSCPARTPAPGNVTFHPTAASAHAAGFRACKRCLPDATPGSPEWDVAADVAGRAMRLIADGLVDREGVDGLARRVGYTPRHLGRLLTQELGAGPLALARARRAQSARVLIETTDLPLTDVAFAAGFASVRQFNETLREIYASSPSELRGRRAGARSAGAVTMRLPVRTPFAGRRMLDFLAYHLVPGVEVAGPGWYARTLDLPHVRGTPGLRVPGQVDGDETAIRTVIGQQVSVTGARTVAGRLVVEHGRPVASDVPGLTHLFPDAATLAAADPTTLPMPRARGRALVGLAAALADGRVLLDRGPDRDDVRRALLDLPGIGPWTADYVAMRALGHPDVFLPTDLAVRRLLAGLATPEHGDPEPERWRPWRSYALMHLWNTLMPDTPAPSRADEEN